MRLVVRGKNVELTSPIREYAEAKLARLEALLGEEVPVEVELGEETKLRPVAEATVFTKGQTIRASESADTLRAAVDALVDNLERQVIRYREKRRVEPRRRAAHHGE